jgi:hypothetical protein
MQSSARNGSPDKVLGKAETNLNPTPILLAYQLPTQACAGRFAESAAQQSKDLFGLRR